MSMKTNAYRVHKHLRKLADALDRIRKRRAYVLVPCMLESRVIVHRARR